MKSLYQYITERNQELLDKLGKILKRGEKYQWGTSGFNGYYHKPEDMNKLNPAFGFKDTDSKHGMYSKGVGSIWMRDYDRPERVTVTISNYGHKDDGKEITAKEMTDQQLETVIKFAEEKVSEVEERMEKNKKNPKIEDVADEILDVCKSYIKDNNKNYIVELNHGRRGNDDKPYYAIVISKTGRMREQVASIALLQDDRKTMSAKLQVVLGGTYDPKEFNMENMEEIIMKLLKRVIG